jgi:non-specific serine/threonine protein kinase
MGRPVIGDTLSHFRITRKLGGGGMGVVYEAEDTRLDRRVALKFLPDSLSRDRRALERLQREARAASALNHPNICTIHDLGEHDGRHFIAMELLEGRTLEHCIGSGPLPLERILDIALQLSQGLEAATRRGSSIGTSSLRTSSSRLEAERRSSTSASRNSSVRVERRRRPPPRRRPPRIH